MHHHRLLLSALGLLAPAIISPALAQTWRGSEAIGVQATDSKGKPIVGARVVLSYQGRGSEGAPPEVATDPKGRAVVANLASGEWQVEVQHPDFLSYVAVFDLQQGKKPSVSASFLEAGGRSLTPMKVKLSKASPRDSSPPLPIREARSQTPPPVEPSPTEETTLAPEPEPDIQGAATPIPIASPAPAPTIEEPVISEVEEAPVPEPTAEPVAVLPQGQPTAQQQASPSTEEATVPPAPAVEPLPEPALEPLTVEQEPEIRQDLPVAPVAAEKAPAEPESSQTAESVAGPPEAQTPPPSAPETGSPAQSERASAETPEPIADAPIDYEPVEVPPEQADQPPVPAEIAEEAPRQEPASASAPLVPEQAEAVAAVPEIAPSPKAPTAAPHIAVPHIAAPGDAPAISSYRDGSCSECRTGEWAVTASQVIAAGSAGCPAEVTAVAEAAADSLGNSMQLELSGFVGPAADGSSGESLATVEPAISQAFRQQLAPYLGAASSCQVVSVVLPKSVRFAGFRYAAFEEGGGGECTPDRGCLLANARWLANPVVQRGFNATVVWGIFENTAADSQRSVRFRVYFRPPNASWQPSSR